MKPISEIRIIVDTNLWISFLIGKKLHCLLELLACPEIQLVVSQELIDEVSDVFHRPKFLKYYTEEKLSFLWDFMREEALFCYLADIPARCRDPKDDYLLELAVVSEADYLITGDRDLLDFGDFGRCKIVTASEFGVIASSMGHPTTLSDCHFDDVIFD